MENKNLCPCESQKLYKECCETFHLSLALPQNALDLMKSRYSAFAKHKFYYLVSTTDPMTLHSFNHTSNEQWGKTVEFTKLEIINYKPGLPISNVEFKAHFKHNGKNFVHHEKSTFRFDGKKWFYQKGEAS